MSVPQAAVSVPQAVQEEELVPQAVLAGARVPEAVPGAQWVQLVPQAEWERAAVSVPRVVPMAQQVLFAQRVVWRLRRNRSGRSHLMISTVPERKDYQKLQGKDLPRA